MLDIINIKVNLYKARKSYGTLCKMWNNVWCYKSKKLKEVFIHIFNRNSSLNKTRIRSTIRSHSQKTFVWLKKKFVINSNFKDPLKNIAGKSARFRGV